MEEETSLPVRTSGQRRILTLHRTSKETNPEAEEEAADEDEEVRAQDKETRKQSRRVAVQRRRMDASSVTPITAKAARKLLSAQELGARGAFTFAAARVATETTA